MAPFPLCYLFSSCDTDIRRTLTPRLLPSESQIKTQWHSPSDILSLLLILGPEVVQRALAQLVGTYYVPIGFSFGWVAYSFNALLAIAGGKVDTRSPQSLLTYEDGQLMPEADCQALVVTAQSGHYRINKAWIIGRLLRDFEKRAAPFASSKASDEWEALRVSVFEWDERREQRKPIRDWVWCSGLAVVVLQIAISAVPLALWSEWATLALVTGGILLASAQAGLPQWKAEKWACPSGGKTISITRGNGHRHVMVLLGSPTALNLEILASGACSKEQSLSGKAAVAILAALWIVLLITVAGLKQGSWCKLPSLSRYNSPV